MTAGRVGGDRVRLGVGGLLHETNTFAAQPTTYEDFERAGIYRGDELLDTFRGTTGTLGGALDACAELRLEPVPLLSTFATPSGMVDHAAYERLRDELLARIESAGRLDAVFLALHGAMVTSEEQDAEGDLLEAVRRAVGDDVPVVATLDLHGNLTPRMAANCTAWVGYKTYPHVDYYPRAVEATRIARDAATRVTRPALALVNVPILSPAQRMLTSAPPMRALVERAVELEQEPGVLSVTVMGGFPYADVKWAGLAVTAVCDGDGERARQICEEIAATAWEGRAEFRHEAPPPREGVAAALAAPEAPVAIVDASDNVGGGAAGDGTAVLAELLAQGARAAVCTLYDPEAVEAARRAGLGAAVELSVGGKTDDRHGEPVPVRCRVEHLGEGSYRSERTGEPQSMGACAVLRCEGVRLLVTSARVPAFDVEALRSVGIEPERQQAIVVKGAVQWRSSFGQICPGSVEVDAPGVTRARLEALPYARVRRPIFPLDPD